MKFLVIYYAPEKALQEIENASYDEIVEATKPWMEWKSSNENHIVDFGSRLTNGQERSANVNWKDNKKEISGFSILQGENIEEVKSILNNHPQMVWSPECNVGIYEFNAF